MKKETLVIVGLGLMGGSLALAVRRRLPSVRVLAVSRDRRKLAIARRRRMIHGGSTSLAGVVRGARAVCLATPVSALKGLLLRVDRVADPGTLVFDLGSTKEDLVSWANRRTFRAISFAGCHPLAGSHDSGLHAARADLYERAPVFLVPTRSGGPAAVACLARFWRSLAARPVRVDARAHDLLCGWVSHLPHLVACTLTRAVLERFPRGLALRPARFAGPGFLDSTRVAAGSASVWKDIFATNRAAVRKALAVFQRELASARRLIDAGDWTRLGALLERAARSRRSLPLTSARRSPE